MKKLDGKVAVITGGSRGLGFAIAQAFVHEGACVVIGSRSSKNIDAAVQLLREQGGQVFGYPCDTSQLEQVQALAGCAVERFGGIDIWVNNAGTSCPTGPTAHVPHEMFVDLVQTNILGTYHGSLVAMRQFLIQNRGKLINLIGKGDRAPVPLHNAYASSRAWVRNFTLALAQEYRSTGVGVFLLNPGIVETDMLKHVSFIQGYEHKLNTLRVVVRLLANPPDLPAQKAVWLASEATDGRTGLQISVIGMRTLTRGILREIRRILAHREVPLFNPEVQLIKPAIDVPMNEMRAGLAQEVRPTNPLADTHQHYLAHLRDRRLPKTIGNKAHNLRLLTDKKFNIPNTYVCTWDAYHAYQEDQNATLVKLRSELARTLEPDKDYAVRSSANVEDDLEYSFAGQFKTVLNARGTDRVLAAICEVWESCQSNAVQSYLEKRSGDTRSLSMGVIIQEMVEPRLSGVSFSKNPITALDEVVIEAVQGSGTRLVQDGVTPYRWINKWGNWIEQPVDAQIHHEIIHEIVLQTRQIARKFKRDVDLEWVYDGKDLYWLQLRDITSNQKANIYSNKIAKEMTPGLIKPLVWSVTMPIPAAVWINLFSRIIGKNDLDPASLAKAFYYRAYHNVGVFGNIFESLGMPRESLEIMMGVAPPGAGKPPFKPNLKMLGLLPRFFAFAWDKWTFARKLQEEYPRIEQDAKAYPLIPPEDMEGVELLTKITQIKDLNYRSTYHTVLSILLMQLYNGLLNSNLKAAGIDYQQFHLTEGMNELQQYDPVVRLERLNQLFLNLDGSTQQKIIAAGHQSLAEVPEASEFLREFEEFMQVHGHLSDATGDFGSVPWREKPDNILELIYHYQKPALPSTQKIRFEDVSIKGLRGVFFRLIYQRARQFRLFREKYSSQYTYTLMLFRAYYLAIGERMVSRGLIESPADILFLYDTEVRDYFNGQISGETFKYLIQQRKDEMERYRDATLPTVIFGDNPPPLIPESKRMLAGIPTSRGYYTGKTKVVRGIADFHKLVHGDVLIIPYSDVGWVPLFARAGAVIAESGGMLSHSSIIAREYGIPAVVSVNGAMQLNDDMLVSIDGYRGEIIVHENAL